MKRHFLALALALGLAGACDTGQEPAPSSEPAAPAPSAAKTAVPAAASPHAELDALDARRPVPLLPMMAHHQKQNMRDHLSAVQEIVAALAKNDLAAVEKAAARLGSTDQMKRMCTHMGAAAPGFTPQALEFHETADEIGKAAKSGDRDKTLSALSTTLAKCNGCHASFKQKVVSPTEWQAAAGTAPPSAPH